MGSNGYGFTLPSDFGSGTSSFAGLSGVQSGMSLPTESAGSNSFGFSMPSSSTNLAGLSNSLGAASKTLSSPTSSTQRASGANGRMALQAQNFTAPIGDMLATGGSSAGNSLIALLQKYAPGGAA
ncbi:hypothetical protein [Paraburkholderia sp. Ac-20340]|uniref:hypothetical protein n=1 Tax=Paraburkholderia sp. Ac-20340 TaxID=2703888 RepID=UPI00197EF32A|nr:hypothetical protein [Paraburkholderia sp. Ac-20340]